MDPILVDTNVISELMRPAPNPQVVAWFSRLEGFAFSVVSLEEVRFGLALRRSARVERIFQELLERYGSVLPVTAAVAETAAMLRATQRMRGRTRTQADMLIAATAHVHGLRLATRNARDFDGCGVRLVDPFRGEPG
jgi:toxin FitB